MSTSRTVSVSLIWLSSLRAVVIAGDQLESCLHLALHHELGKNASRLLLCFADS